MTDSVRCLEEFPCRLEFQMVDEYYQTVAIDGGAALKLPHAPETFSIDANHVIDMSEAVRQNTLLAVPLKPLCDRACQGICPHCGRNLNQGTCGCAVPQVDPRLKPLLELEFDEYTEG